MKKKKYFILKYSIIQLFIILNCCGCITEYVATDLDQISGILVVEGVITDNESIITLSRSVNFTDRLDGASFFVNDARVYVECDDGTLLPAERPHWGRRDNGQYTIKTGELDPNRKYCLKFEIDEVEPGCNMIRSEDTEINCPIKTYEYRSDSSYPIQTPEIDSLFWSKRGKGQPVNIHVATHSSDNKLLFCRWSYKEDWEIKSNILMDYDFCNSCQVAVPASQDYCPNCGIKWRYPYTCWNAAVSSEIILGSTEKTVFGRVSNLLKEIQPTDNRLSVMYRIDVKQNAISKRAYDYYTNIKKNADQSGSIFAPVPSELRGNIFCTTDQGKPVIGYIEVSMTVQKRRYFSSNDVAYEKPFSTCEIIQYPGPPPTNWVYYFISLPSPFSPPLRYIVQRFCVDCTMNGGSLNKPVDWDE